jgi:hypothetical protein
MGNSILQAESTEDWGKKRKVLAAAFYKDKLIKMNDIVKRCMGETVLKWRKDFIKEKKEFDLIE